ncbi:MAG: PAS domain S-box protein [Rhodanobacteraceae bacterium]|nr:PAS domain S-box protein [Rhodanobacteraceae bacterium]
MYVNPAFERQTGYRAEEVLGRTPRLLQGAGTDTAELQRIGAALHAWQPVRAEVLNYRKDGSAFWTEMAISPVVDRSGSYTHWVSVQRDVSVRKQSEAEREHLIRELEKRNSELDTYNHSVAHDLRNPVISIRGMADLARMAIEANDPTRAGDCIARIARSADQADTLIRNLMELAKLGKRAIRLQPLPARDAFESMRAALDLQIAAVSAQVRLEVPDGLVLHSDPVLLQMIFGNLVGNALKHRHPGRAPLIVVDIRESARPAGWRIDVRDNGIGIHPELHDRVFRLFERVDDRSEGTGVGLALVDRAARLLEGEVCLVESAPGHGSCFSVWLPALAA